MTNASKVKDLIRQAMAKSASMSTERSDENAADIEKTLGQLSVDSQTAADAVGRMAKDPIYNIGTTAESSNDVEANGMTKIKNDDKAFMEAPCGKSASDLRKLASSILTAINKAAADALTVKEPGAASEDDKGKEQVVPGALASSDGTAVAQDSSTDQTTPPKMETETGDKQKDPAVKSASTGELAYTLYKMANDLLVSDDVSAFCKRANLNPEDMKGSEGELTEGDIEGLPGDESDEVAAALQASATDAANEGVEDADNVSEYLSAYQQAPGVMGAEGAPAEGAPAEGAPAEGGAELDQLAQVLEEAGITPEELMAMVAEQGAPEAPVQKEASWSGLTKEAKRAAVLSAIKDLGGKK